MYRRLMLAAGLLGCVIAIASGPPARADEAQKPFLDHLFTDNMVLQRDVEDPIWGWTDPGKDVTVTVGDKKSTATAGVDGKWTAKIAPQPAGGPYTVTVEGPQTVKLANVLFGDVWICSGQSNMEMGIGIAKNAETEIANATYPNIRLFTVPKKVAVEPEWNVDNKWQVCSPETIAAGGWGGFSAAGYYFGRTLYQKLNVPIGLIHTSWGGTIAEAWTSAEALSTMPDFQGAVSEMQATASALKQGNFDYDKKLEEWYLKNDPGTSAATPWSEPVYNTDGWKTMQLPTNWEAAGLPDYDGIVWFRREFDLPKDWEGKDLMLHLGPVDDMDTTYVNNERVGAMHEWTLLRDYKVSSKILKPGKNLIAVRVLDTGGNGGIYGKPELMKIEVVGDPNAAPISLTGPWLYKDSMPLNKTTPLPPAMNSNPNQVTVLYNGMISPLLPLAIKGAIWYQGESNAGRAAQYRKLLHTMITDWRTRFGVGDFPFFIVQLASFMPTHANPVDTEWAKLREAQWQVSQETRKTGLALAIDIGDVNDIHPKNKQEVGRRLALSAEKIAYGLDVVGSGPTYHKMAVEGSKIRLSFDNLGGGLVAQGDEKLKGFAIAGEDGKFVWADAAIDGDTVVVSSPDVEKPTAVRYAWDDTPIANLYNKAGLPAVPFRTNGPA